MLPAKPDVAVTKKRSISTLLFVVAAVWLVIAGWEVTTGRSFPGRRGRTHPVTEERAYNMLFAAGAILAAACFRRAWESS
jgi:hypothetical protein